MKQVYTKIEQCYGCSACEQICPKLAIEMNIDSEGFKYPCIDVNKCIDCGMCKKVCPYLNNTNVDDFKQRYFAVQHNKKEVVAASSSGGMFTALSDTILKQKGVVYGVGFDDGFVVSHMKADNYIMRDRFRGSKYVQSDMNTVMKHIVDDLLKNIPVMFVGTPCQVAGVKNYVLSKRKTIDGLFLCDFICHGTASPKVWASYVNYFGQKYSTGLQYYNFRGKANGWHQWQPIMYADDKDISAAHEKKDSFRLMYQTCLLNRPSCYSCKYSSYERPSDVTIADFWNIGKVAPYMDNNDGTSQVLVNTLKGQSWFEDCKGDIRFVECKKEDVWQPHLEYPNACPTNRGKFWEFYNTREFSNVLSQYGKGDVLTKCKNLFTPVFKKLGLYVVVGKIYKLVFMKRENK